MIPTYKTLNTRYTRDRQSGDMVEKVEYLLCSDDAEKGCTLVKVVSPMQFRKSGLPERHNEHAYELIYSAFMASQSIGWRVDYNGWLRRKGERTMGYKALLEEAETFRR